MLWFSSLLFLLVHIHFIVHWVLTFYNTVLINYSKHMLLGSIIWASTVVGYVLMEMQLHNFCTIDHSNMSEELLFFFINILKSITLFVNIVFVLLEVLAITESDKRHLSLRSPQHHRLIIPPQSCMHTAACSIGTGNRALGKVMLTYRRDPKNSAITTGPLLPNMCKHPAHATRQQL